MSVFEAIRMETLKTKESTCGEGLKYHFAFTAKLALTFMAKLALTSMSH
jgi:hypothetical protein